MRKLFRKLQQTLKQLLSLLTHPGMNKKEIDRDKIIFSASIAISAIIMQSFIATGATDLWALASVVSFAISIPFLVMYMYVTSILEIIKDTPAPKVLVIPYLVGPFFCFSGIIAAFGHISVIAGLIFYVSAVISALIFLSLKPPFGARG